MSGDAGLGTVGGLEGVLPPGPSYLALSCVSHSTTTTTANNSVINNNFSVKKLLNLSGTAPQTLYDVSVVVTDSPASTEASNPSQAPTPGEDFPAPGPCPEPGGLGLGGEPAQVALHYRDLGKTPYGSDNKPNQLESPERGAPEVTTGSGSPYSVAGNSVSSASSRLGSGGTLLDTGLPDTSKHTGLHPLLTHPGVTAPAFYDSGLVNNSYALLQNCANLDQFSPQSGHNPAPDGTPITGADIGVPCFAASDPRQNLYFNNMISGASTSPSVSLAGYSYIGDSGGRDRKGLDPIHTLDTTKSREFHVGSDPSGLPGYAMGYNGRSPSLAGYVPSASPSSYPDDYRRSTLGASHAHYPDPSLPRNDYSLACPENLKPLDPGQGASGNDPESASGFSGLPPPPSASAPSPGAFPPTDPSGRTFSGSGTNHNLTAGSELLDPSKDRIPKIEKRDHMDLVECYVEGTPEDVKPDVDGYSNPEGQRIGEEHRKDTHPAKSQFCFH